MNTSTRLLAALAVPLVPLAAIGALYALRTPTTRHFPTGGAVQDVPPVDDPRFLQLVERYAGMPILPGHEVDLLLNGDGTYPPLWRDLRGARRSITVQNYFVEPGRLTTELFSILRERAEAGVEVRVLYDVVGSTIPSEELEALHASGVEVRAFRPFRPARLHLAIERSHARVVVVDGEVAYTGGFGFADKWEGSGRSPDEWRETSVRFTGPAVRQLQAAFGIAWVETAGTLLTGEAFFPPEPEPRPEGPAAGLMYSRPTGGSTAAMRFLSLTLAAARHRLYLANSYFAPLEPVLGLLEDAGRRGVDVRLLTAGPRTDVPPVRHAGRARYERLLRAGVRIWEYQPAMMHAKTFVADGRWCTVGAMNLDNRSTALMDEATLAVLDEGLGAEMERVFLDDLSRSHEIVLPEFRRRPVLERVAEQGADAVSRVL
jgi:cardiolipin synthase A/B